MSEFAKFRPPPGEAAAGAAPFVPAAAAVPGAAAAGGVPAGGVAGVAGSGGVSPGPTEIEGSYAWNWARTIWADALA